MGMNFKLNFILASLGVVLVSIFFHGVLDAQEIIPTNTISVENTSLYSLPASLSWNLMDKLQEKEDELLKTPLWIGTKNLVFYEDRISSNGSITKKKLQDEERDIALKILNIYSGEVKIIKLRIVIDKKGLRLVSPAGYEINIPPRSNGIRWNKWNNVYQINEPRGWIVLKNKYPERINSKKVEERIYSPYSSEIHKPEIVEAGREYLYSVVQKAFEDLKIKKVYSKAVPGQLISEVPALKQEIFRRLPLIEGMDFAEFIGDPQKSYERVLVLIGSNGDDAYYWTESSAGARGWLQYTPKTYSNIRRAYPVAKLDVNHKTGASDHINSMEAAILLHDSNLAVLVKKFGSKILIDPKLEEYLAGAYNGAPKWVHNSLNATILQGLSDWINALSPIRKDSRGGLRNETKSYMLKIRYLQEKGLP